MQKRGRSATLRRIVLELSFGVAILEPKITERRCLMVLLAMPMAVLLSPRTWVGGCGWPISARATHIGTASWLL